jgi:hypothetical protein
MKRKRFTANFVGIAYLVTIRENYHGTILKDKRVYHFDGWVDHPKFEKIARNIIAAQVKKDMSIYSHLRGFSIESIEEL